MSNPRSRLVKTFRRGRWTTSRTSANQKRLSTDDAIDILGKLFRKMEEAEKTNAGYVRRGVLTAQDKFKEVAGKSTDEALEHVHAEYEEYNIRAVVQWFLD